MNVTCIYAKTDSLEVVARLFTDVVGREFQLEEDEDGPFYAVLVNGQLSNLLIQKAPEGENEALPEYGVEFEIRGADDARRQGFARKWFSEALAKSTVPLALWDEQEGVLERFEPRH